jgi:hypothetical protein
MLSFGITIPATVPQRSEIPEGLINYPVFITFLTLVPTTEYDLKIGHDRLIIIPFSGIPFELFRNFFPLLSVLFQDAVGC